MSIDVLLDLMHDQPVMLACKTSGANIFLRENASGSRKRCAPEPVQLMCIPYSIDGRFQAIQTDESTGITYVVMITNGEAAIINPLRGKVVNTEIRQKVAHVPIGAITKVIFH